MSYYRKLIMKDVAVDEKTAVAIEALMRDVIFHSTLDWQTAKQFKQGAKEALEVFNELDKETKEFYLSQG